MRDKWILIGIPTSVHCDLHQSSPRVLSKQTTPSKPPSSYLPVVDTETFAATHDRNERRETRHHEKTKGFAGRALRPE